jgi:hypothetical protein
MIAASLLMKLIYPVRPFPSPALLKPHRTTCSACLFPHLVMTTLTSHPTRFPC